MPNTRDGRNRLYVFLLRRKWYWWLISCNGYSLACCPKGFTRRDNAVKSADETLREGFTVIYEMPPRASATAEQQLFFFQEHSKSIGELLLAATSRR